MKTGFRWKFASFMAVIIILSFIVVAEDMKISKTHASTKAKSSRDIAEYSVRAPIPKLPYVSNRSFYLLVNTGQTEEFVKLDISFQFVGINQQECFERNDPIFRDVVYRFLKEQHPQRNTAKGWNEILKNQLSRYLAVNPGRCRVSSIIVESVQRF
ncbi:MAG: hypothetical protein WHS38_07325 [Thermodesulforhabdaceae bacterium]|jgi:hypothetical protein